MSEFWSFLTQPDNRETLSWLGGGLVVACGGLWVVLKFFLGRRGGGGAGSSGGASSPAPVSAQRGGVAAGRDVRIDNRSGLPASHLVLLILAFLGAILFAVSQAGTSVSVSNGVGVGGNVEGSSITTQ
jgi:hypothetical protein